MWPIHISKPITFADDYDYLHFFFFSLKCEIHALPPQYQIFFLSKESSILKLGLISFSTSATEAVCTATTFSIIDSASIHASYPLNMSEASLVATAIEAWDFVTYPKKQGILIMKTKIKRLQVIARD